MFMDWLSFCISAATCFETSVEICLDCVDLLVPRDFLVNDDLCASGLFATTRPVLDIVPTLVSCIHGAYGNEDAPQSCQCLVLCHLQQLLQWFQTRLLLVKSVRSLT